MAHTYKFLHCYTDTVSFKLQKWAQLHRKAGPQHDRRASGWIKRWNRSFYDLAERLGAPSQPWLETNPLFTLFLGKLNLYDFVLHLSVRQLFLFRLQVFSLLKPVIKPDRMSYLCAVEFTLLLPPPVLVSAGMLPARTPNIQHTSQFL